MKKDTNKKHKILNKLKDFAFAFIIVFFVCYGLVSIFWKDKIVNIFWFEFSIVKSNSMSGTIEKYDFVVVRKNTKQNVNVGDIVLFFDSTKKHKIIHRVITITENSNQQTMLQTKGDNSPSPDTIWQNANDIYALYAFSVPYLGLIISYFTTYLGMLNALVWLVVFVFLEVVWRDKSIELEQNFTRLKNLFK